MSKKMAVIALMFCLLFLCAGASMAAPWQYKDGDEVIGKKQVINGDLFFSGDRLEIDGQVKGDVILLFAGEVVISGRVEGNVIGLVWQTLTLNGGIGGHLRVLAQNVQVNGAVERSLTVGTLNLVTGAQSVIQGGILCLCYQAQLAGTVNNTVELNSSLASKVGGHIAGDLKNRGNAIEWTSPLEVTGRVDDYTGVTQDPAGVKGVTISRGYHPHATNPLLESQMMKLQLIISLGWFIGSLLLSLIFYRLFPRTAWSMSEPNYGNFRRHVLIGLLSFIGIPVVTLILSFTVVAIPGVFTAVGIPGILFLTLAYFAVLSLAGAPVNLWMGRLLFKSRFKPTLSIILGGLFIFVLNSIPFLNIISFFLFTWLGFGMIIGRLRIETEEKKVDMQI